MILPSIDLMDGHAVQLVGGERRALDAGDPLAVARRFALAGEIAVVDLDAALGRGHNTDVVRELLRIAPCRVGGGIRDVETAIAWLDAGATRVVLGTAARPDVLAALPKERVVAALDARDGEVVVEGWRKRTGRSIEERMAELRNLVGGFLVTFVEREGRMAGLDLDRVRALRAVAPEAELTIAGGVTTPADVAALDELGAHAQVGMALYTGRLHLADAIAAPLRSDRPDGLWPTIVTDPHGVALGLAYSNSESLRAAVEERRGVYWSRRRGLWRKGETSGDRQELVTVGVDCDRDTLRFVVRQGGAGFCHRGTWTCFGEAFGLPQLARVVRARAEHAPSGSYTRRLLEDPALLAAKLAEEARELGDAATRREAVHEAADVIYFALVALASRGGELEEVEAELARRARRVTRRPGNARPEHGPEEGR